MMCLQPGLSCNSRGPLLLGYLPSDAGHPGASPSEENASVAGVNCL